MLIASLIARLLEPAEPGSRAQEEALIAVQRTCPSRARPPRTWYSSTARLELSDGPGPGRRRALSQHPMGRGYATELSRRPRAVGSTFKSRSGQVQQVRCAHLRPPAPAPQSTVCCLAHVQKAYTATAVIAAAVHSRRPSTAARRSLPPAVCGRPPLAAASRHRCPSSAAASCLQPPPCAASFAAVRLHRRRRRHRLRRCHRHHRRRPRRYRCPRPRHRCPRPRLRCPRPRYSRPRPCTLRRRPRPRRLAPATAATAVAALAPATSAHALATAARAPPRPSAHDGRMRDTRTRSRTRARTCTPPAFSACASDAPRLACVRHRVAFKRPLAGHLPGPRSANPELQAFRHHPPRTRWVALRAPERSLLYA